MNEVVEVKFDDEDECDGSDVPDPVFTEKINSHGGSRSVACLNIPSHNEDIKWKKWWSSELTRERQVVTALS